jgi:hypothetical protein
MGKLLSQQLILTDVSMLFWRQSKSSRHGFAMLTTSAAEKVRYVMFDVLGRNAVSVFDDDDKLRSVHSDLAWM